MRKLLLLVVALVGCPPAPAPRVVEMEGAVAGSGQPGRVINLSGTIHARSGLNKEIP